MLTKHLLYPSELSSLCNRPDSNRRPSGFPDALPLSYDRAFVQRNTGTRKARRASQDLTSPDTEPSEGSALMMEF